MNRIVLLAAASLVTLGGVLVSTSLPAQAKQEAVFFGQIEGFEEEAEVQAYLTFRDIETREFLHRDKADLVVSDGRYHAKVNTSRLESGRPYEVEIEGYSGAGSFSLVDFVELQAGSPGSAQTGHLNISGYIVASRIGLGTNATIARVQVNETGSMQGVRSLTQDGTAVYGQANASTGLAAGGYFTSKSAGGRAVIGDALSTSGATVGGLFYNRSQAGVAVWGRHINGSGDSIGVYGETASASGTAVIANNSGAGSRVELAGPNGSIYTEGDLPAHEYISNYAATMVPVAYGTIVGDSTPSFLTSTSNMSVTSPQTGVFEITVNGYTVTPSSSAIVATVVDSNVQKFATSYFGNDSDSFRINIRDVGSDTLTDGTFSFIVFQAANFVPPALPEAFFGRHGGDFMKWKKDDPRGYAAYVSSLTTAHKASTRKNDVDLPVDSADREFSGRPLVESR